MARKSRKNIEVKQVTVLERPVHNAAAYIRLSVEDNRKKGDSLDTQRSILQNYVAITPGLKLHDFYIDNGVSGTSFERPAFKKMLADAENGVINCIIVKDLSRFGRNVIDAGYYIEQYLPTLNVRFISINDNFDTDNINPGDRLMLPIKNMINEAYALDISRKVKAQQRESMKAGEFIGGRPPYGYLKSQTDCHKLIIDEATAPIVRQIFEWSYNGAGLNTIVLRLNEAGVVTPSHTKKASGLITHDNLIGKGAWQTRTVAKILSCELYTGDMVQGKTKTVCHRQTLADESNWIRVESTHDAIISREMFDAVQVSRKQITEKSAQKPKTPWTPNMFKGKIFCGHCGGSLHRQRCERRKSNDVYMFHCMSNSRIAHDSCIPYILPEEELLSLLLTMIQKHAETVIGKSMRLRNNQIKIEAGRSAVKSELSAVRQELDKDKRLLKSLFESLSTGLISSDEYRQMRGDYESRISDRLKTLDELERKQAGLESQVKEYFAISDIIKNVGGKNDITAELIDRLVEKIQVFPDRSIEVTFSFESGFERLNEVCGHE